MRLYASTTPARLCAAAACLLLAARPTLAGQVAQPDAVETMAAPGSNGADYSANAPSMSGLNLLATIPTPSTARRGYFVEAQCTAGLTVVLDDAAGSQTPTVVVLAGSATNGGQGASIDMNGMPHTGRIRIYSSASNCQMAARVW
jgi:hypothetical protein